jgi:serine/threonine protein kinase
MYYFGKYKNRFSYLVMELLGPSLLSILIRMPFKRFTLNTVLKFALDSLEALEMFHRKGMVHRDIKMVWIVFCLFLFRVTSL